VKVTAREVPDPALTALYQEQYGKFKRIYPAMKEIFPLLNA